LPNANPDLGLGPVLNLQSIAVARPVSLEPAQAVCPIPNPHFHFVLEEAVVP
jgi:hypothetical protein